MNDSSQTPDSRGDDVSWQQQAALNSHLMAMVAVCRAEVQSAVEVFQSFVEALPAEYQPSCSISDQFFRRRSEIIQAQLISVEDKDTGFASSLQKIVDDYKLDENDDAPKA